MAEIFQTEIKQQTQIGAFMRLIADRLLGRKHRIVATKVDAACGPCHNAQACCQALEVGTSDSDVPGFCRNSDMFIRLQAEVEKATGPVTR
ncbi:MAG: DUF6455 family protein [Pseudomonadota bacterium]